MNEEQKRYTVEQIEKYDKETHKLHSKAFNSAVGAMAGFAMICVGVIGLTTFPFLDLGPSYAEMQSTGTLASITSIVVGSINGGASLQTMIERVAKMAGLENMITELEYDLKMDELGNQEKGGKSK